MSISPISTSGYYPRPTATPSAVPAAAVTPVPTTTAQSQAGSSLRPVTDVVRSAMSGQPLAGASGLQAKALDLIKRGQAAVSSMISKISPTFAAKALPPVSAQEAIQLTPFEKAKQIARSAVFFALPIGGAAAVAAGLGWLIGPLVPVVGGHVFGAVAAALAVGHTSGFLLHSAMRLPLVTDPARRELNSAGTVIGSAAIGVGLAAAIGAGAGMTVGLPLLAAGAALGAVPRLVEWAIARI